MSTHVFVGPTLAAREVASTVPGAAIHAPISHGDLLRLDLGAGDTAVIVDGYFHRVPSVRHKEILWVLSRGVRVVGCASMGALRAAELAPYGMIGNGVVFEMYRDGVIDADDEVAVLHTEGPEYRTLGVPLVNIRHAVAAAADAGVVSASQASELIARGRRLPYPQRSWRAVESALARDEPAWAGVFERLREFLTEHPEHAAVKTRDARDTLRRLEELRAPGWSATTTWSQSPMWRNRLLHKWRADCSGVWVDGRHVSYGEVMRFQQLYRADFPPRWSSFALEGIADHDQVPAGPEPGATARVLAAAAEYGLTAEAVTPEQRTEWLTAAECGQLDPEAAMLRILIRSYRPPRGVFDLVTAFPDLVTDSWARRGVAESAAVNAEVASWGDAHSVDHLKPEVLSGHLAAVWRVGDARSLLAAARDRGFRSVVEAVEASRPFFLRHHVATPDPAEPGTGTS